MMNEMVRWSSTDLVASRKRAGLRSGFAGVLGGLLMVAALAAASLIAVVFAATLAVIMVLASVLLALTAVAWRARPRTQAQHTQVQDALTIRRAGHAWVAYGWDRPGR